jgi:hypothetical protein
MGEEVEEREEDGKGLLHAEEAVEGPFPVELDDSYIGCDALVGNYVLAGVVAFCWAIPEKEAVEESWSALEIVWRRVGVPTDCCDMVAITILLLADLSLLVGACGLMAFPLPRRSSGIPGGGPRMMQRLGR